MMKKGGNILVALVTFATVAVCLPAKAPTEYELKAAYLYRFLQFADWPEASSEEPKHSVTIGILGKDPFKKEFEPVEGKPVKGRKLVIKRFDKDSPADSFKQCDLLFISSSLRGQIKLVLKSLEHSPVLTVSETRGFVEMGGMINLVKKKNEIKFEINKASAERAGIKFHSKLLRLAIRVVEDDNEERTKER